MDTQKGFSLELDYEGLHYSGEVLPSEELDDNGFPIYFRVEIGGKLYAYICCGERGWRNRDEPHGHNGLINAIGNYIFDWYE